MCNPLLAVAAVSAVVGVAGAVQQHNAAKQQAMNAEYAANINFARNKETLSAKAAQQDQRHTEDAFTQKIAALKEQGRIAAASNEQGLSAPSSARQSNLAAFDAGRSQSITELNFLNERAQLGRDATSNEDTRTSTILANPKPSNASLYLGVASGVMQGVSTYYGGKKAG